LNRKYYDGNPAIAILCLIVSVSIVAFSRYTKTPIVGIIIGFVLTYTFNLDLRRIVKPVVSIIVVSLIASIPSMFIGTSLATVTCFLLRSASSALLLTVIVSALNWIDIAIGMSILRIPKVIVTQLAITMIFIPRFLRSYSNTLLAKRARIISNDRFSFSWDIASRSIGDMIVRGFHLAWKLDKAVKARSLQPIPVGSSSSSISKLTMHDIILSACTVTLITVFLYSEVASCL